jgi:MFS transporter, DHA1 family, multidrug resistance protein
VFWVDEPPAPRPRRDVKRASVLAAVHWPGFRGLLGLQLGTQFVFSASIGLLPIYLQELERPDWLSAELASGLAITLTAITAALSMPPMGRWTDRRGPRGLLIVSLIGGAVVMIVQGILPTVGLIMAMRALLGVWLAGVTATLSVLTKQLAPSGSEGAAYGAASSAQGLGWGLGPMLGAGVVAIGGIPALYVLCGFVMLGLTVLTRVRETGVPSRF